MKNLKILLASLLCVFLYTSAHAGSYGIGVAGNMMSVSAEGTETDPNTTGTENSQTSATAGNEVIYGSIFAEYNFGASEQFTLGVDYIPGTADVNRKDLSRTDAEDANGGNDSDDGTRTANAEISDHYTVYGEWVMGAGVYAKVGFTQVDIETNDTSTSASTTGNYPDVELDAWTYGLGMKSMVGDNMFMKIEGTYTDYDTFSATSTTSNTVSADLDAIKATLALGYKF